jgi:hypothetical protein
VESNQACAIGSSARYPLPYIAALRLARLQSAVTLVLGIIVPRRSYTITEVARVPTIVQNLYSLTFHTLADNNIGHHVSREDDAV